MSLLELQLGLMTMDKPTDKQIERAESLLVDDDHHPAKPVPVVDKMDYSGSHEKTDPREIALVKKLDLWIMVRSHFTLVLVDDC